MSREHPHIAANTLNSTRGSRGMAVAPHALASQSALVAEHCKEEIANFGTDAVYGVYRLLERLGNALGPLIASVLVIYYGYEGAFVAICGLVVVCGIALAPRGLFDRGLGKSLVMGFVAGGAMLAVAYFTKPISIFLAVPASVIVYVLVAWFGGAVQPATVDLLKGTVGRRLARFRRAPSA